MARLREPDVRAPSSESDLCEEYLTLPSFLGQEEPWFIKSSEWDPLEGRADLHVSFREGTRFPCPKCGAPIRFMTVSSAPGAT